MRPKHPSQETTAIQFGRFRLIEPIGQGGMAEVWKAKLCVAHDFERTVSVKRILPHLAKDEEFVRMFAREAWLSARLNHPNIVSVFDFGEEKGLPYLAMDFVDGVDLIVVVKALRPNLPLGLAAYVVQEICAALAYAHAVSDENGHPLHIVHRDISPSNVMLTFEGAVKLLDFGIAKAMGATQEETRAGMLKGKISYMAPELISGEPLDHRCDIFAAGVVLHELLTGRRLFTGKSDLELLNRVRACTVAPPSQVRPGVPAELDRICMRALARDPAQRYQSADEMSHDLIDVTRSQRWGRRELIALLRSLRMSSEARERQPSARATTDVLVAPSAMEQTARRWSGRHGLACLLLLALVVATGLLLARPGRRTPSVRGTAAHATAAATLVPAAPKPPPAAGPMAGASAPGTAALDAPAPMAAAPLDDSNLATAPLAASATKSTSPRASGVARSARTKSARKPAKRARTGDLIEEF